jgi:hypothetical protein
VWAEQAIFTSLSRGGRGGYHLVSRSRSLNDTEAQALTQWAPSHGALIVDGCNRTSVNFHRLPGGRFALSRTCAGPAEYSGRGGRQLYTHFLIVEEPALEAVGFQPLALYRDAMAMGYLLYQPDPDEVLEPVRLPRIHARRDSGYWEGRAVEMELPPLAPLSHRLQEGHPLRFAYNGDRIALAECLIGVLPRDTARRISWSTSLIPSSMRPVDLTLVSGDCDQGIRERGVLP